jgi:hypothetical protein
MSEFLNVVNEERAAGIGPAADVRAERKMAGNELAAPFE